LALYFLNLLRNLTKGLICFFGFYCSVLKDLRPSRTLDYCNTYCCLLSRLFLSFFYLIFRSYLAATPLSISYLFTLCQPL